MKLFDGGRVPNARRVRVFLAEKGLTVDTVPVDLGKNEHKSAEVTRRNPLQRVPLLELDDGTIITESIAICRYFEETDPNPPLFGEGARGRALVEMWQRRLELNLFFPVVHVFRHTNPAMAGWEVPQVAAWGDANRGHYEAFLKVLDADLAGREFVAGDHFSVADITGFIALDFARVARLPKPDGYPNVARWFTAMAGRPSAAA